MGQQQSPLERAELVIRGARGELRLAGGMITVDDQGDAAAAPTHVEFPARSVRGVTVNPPSNGTRGWVHVSTVGGSPPPPTELAAVGDPYTLQLTRRGVSAAKKLHKLVEKHHKTHGMPVDDRGAPGAAHVAVPRTVVVTGSTAAGPPSDPTSAPAATSVPARPGEDRPEPVSQPLSTDAAASGGDKLIAQLKELAALHDAGALTDDEFAAAKARLLGTT